jgi:hypothetical protein
VAWQTLTSAAPFNALPTAPDLERVIILMTDGDNTQNRWTSSQTSIDARTQRVCDNIKADNIKLYTVRMIAGNATLLQAAQAIRACISTCSTRRSSTLSSAPSHRTSPIFASRDKQAPSRPHRAGVLAAPAFSFRAGGAAEARLTIR